MLDKTVLNGKYGSFDYLHITKFMHYPNIWDIKALYSEFSGFRLSFNET